MFRTAIHSSALLLVLAGACAAPMDEASFEELGDEAFDDEADFDDEAFADDEDVAANTEELSAWFPLQEGTDYVIWNAYTRKCMDVAGGRTTSGTPINQYGCHHGGAQRFRVEIVGRPDLATIRARLRNPNSNMCVVEYPPADLDPTRPGIQSNGADRVVIDSCGGPQSEFLIRRTGNYGSYSTVYVFEIKSAWQASYSQNYCLDVPGGTSANSYPLQFYPQCHRGPVQQWLFSPAVNW